MGMLKMNINRKLILILLSFVLIGFLACSPIDDNADDTTNTTDTTDTTDTDGSAPEAAAIALSSSNGTVLLNGTATITATVYNESGEEMSGTTVYFLVSNPTLASITSSSTTNSLGVATATLTARNIAGNVTVSAFIGSLISVSNPEITISSSSPPASISLTATPATLQVNQQATISAYVRDGNDSPITNGTSVTFTVNNSSLGSMSAGSATTSGGYATSTFSATGNAGTVVITAVSGDISETVSIDILQSPAQSIEFISAEPQRIALSGTAGSTSSVVTFRVLNSGGDGVNGINVSLELAGPNGGEYLNSESISSDANGYARVILNSGAVAGPVTISGTITTAAGDYTTNSSTISIGGGVPSAKTFSVATETLNLPGLVYANRQTDITAYLSDRFENYNVLEGTTVSFASEVGFALLSSNVTVDEYGTATVTGRTQPPASGVAPEDVEPIAWEIALHDRILTEYGLDFIGNPRDGLVSVLVYTPGEEHFYDTNANGEYDVGENFDDTADDPYLDFNDNGTYDGPTSSDPQEIFIDTNDNEQWDGFNNDWDDNKVIFTNIKILLTGSPIIASNTDNFDVPNGDSLAIKFLVCDKNINPLPEGTTIAFSLTGGGKTVGKTSYTQADSSIGGQIEFGIIVADSDDAKDSPEAVVLDITVTWEGVAYYGSISGTIN